MSYTADSIRIVTPDSIRIRFERKRPIRRSLIIRCSSSASIEDSCAYADFVRDVAHLLLVARLGERVGVRYHV